MVAAKPGPEYVVDFPTLFIAVDWVERHCIIPDGFRRGYPFEMYDWQAWCTLNHYRVRRDARWIPDSPLMGTAFVYRRSQVIAPQKMGKGPWSATGVALEGAGPALFAGWAAKDDGYACAEHGCGCGWEYPYRPGEAMGMRWPTPLIQIAAKSEDQTDNIFRPLQAMIKFGPLGDLMKAGEEFVRIGEEGRIDVVTSAADSRLGNPTTYAAQDETGIWTATNKMIKFADTQRRGIAGMQGRSQETTNAFDPTQKSQAQLTFQSAATDIFKFYEPPPKGLNYAVKAERRKIHRAVYRGVRHINLDAIEGEANELILKGDKAQAARFYGNDMVAGAGAWMDRDEWNSRRVKPRVVPKGTPVVLGFDGSDIDDWTALRAETEDGYQFTPTYGPAGKRLPTIWNPADWNGQVPRLEVANALDELMNYFVVVRMYFDPPYWPTEGDEWAAKYGEKRVIRWATARPVQMQAADMRLHTDVTKADSTFTHDGCPTTSDHITAIHKDPRPGGRYALVKPEDGRKIDAGITSIICHEAAGDVTAAGSWPKPVVAAQMTVFRSYSRR
jgi:hypothetical protein